MKTYSPLEFSDIAFTLVAHSPFGIMACDETGVICLVNQALAALTGYTQAELIGEGVAKLVPFSHPNHAKDIASYFRRLESVQCKIAQS